MAVETYFYLDKTGTLLPAGQGRAAKYKVEHLEGVGYVLMEKDHSKWSMLHSGTLQDLELWLKRHLEAPSSTPVLVPAEPVCVPQDVAKVVLARVDYMRGIDLRQVSNYLFMAISRNNCSERNRVIHTRLVDKIGQPIYILYTGDFTQPVSLSYAHLVDSISQAQMVFPSLKQTHLPDPLQWSTDTSDYIWDPSMEVLNLTERAVEHISVERTARLSGVLADMEPASLLRNIKEALHTGQQRAKCDCAYALPSYSRRYNNVCMLLPLHVHTQDTELPEAVMLLAKTLHGYSLVTLVTPQQAYMGVRAFRDPELTWLKGALV